MRTENCTTCKYCTEVEKNDAKMYFCVRLAPSANEQGWGRWPRVFPSFWCGSYKAAGAQTPQKEVEE